MIGCLRAAIIALVCLSSLAAGWFSDETGKWRKVVEFAVFRWIRRLRQRGIAGSPATL